ncbi:MAG: hypothetical protein ACRD5H_00580 [Nitrososphaerales archaeon]
MKKELLCQEPPVSSTISASHNDRPDLTPVELRSLPFKELSNRDAIRAYSTAFCRNQDLLMPSLENTNQVRIWRIKFKSKPPKQWETDFYYRGREHELADHPASRLEMEEMELRTEDLHTEEEVKNYLKTSLGLELVSIDPVL